MKRAFVVLSDEAVAIWFAYQAKIGGSRDTALDKLIKEFGKGPTPEPEPEPTPATKYDVEVSQDGKNIIARAGTKQLAAIPLKADAAALFKAAVDNVPEGGTLWIGVMDGDERLETGTVTVSSV